jgi:hypothetical protein
MKIYRLREEILNSQLYQIFDMANKLHKIDQPDVGKNTEIS